MLIVRIRRDLKLSMLEPSTSKPTTLQKISQDSSHQRQIFHSFDAWSRNEGWCNLNYAQLSQTRRLKYYVPLSVNGFHCWLFKKSILLILSTIIMRITSKYSDASPSNINSIFWMQKLPCKTRPPKIRNSKNLYYAPKNRKFFVGQCVLSQMRSRSRVWAEVFQRTSFGDFNISRK